MSNLIRCRGSASEIAARFDAGPVRDLAWRSHIWPGEAGLVVLLDQQTRALQTLIWGLPAQGFVKRHPLRERIGLFARDLVDGGRVRDPDMLTRCLIIIEDVAYPDGPLGARTRSYAGLWDMPLCAWAGLCICREGDNGFAGLLIPANALVARVSAHMPLLLPQEAWQPWLEGEALHALSGVYAEQDWYLEPSGENWSNLAAAGHG